MSDRSRFLRIFTFLTAFGLMSLAGMLLKPSFQAIRLVDVVYLIGTGMCFGGAVVGLVLYLRSPRSR